MKNVKKYRDIKLVTTEKRRKYLVPEPIYHATNFFSENVLAIEMKKKEKENRYSWINHFTYVINNRIK